MDQKYQEILDKAIQMFERIGIRSVSMDDLAQELHMSKKTIYQYFKNKEELVVAMLNRHIERDLNGYECICKLENINAIDILLRVSHEVCLHLNQTNHKQVFELKKYYPEQFLHFWNAKRLTVHKNIKENIEQGIAQKLYRDDLNVDLITTLYVRRLEDFSIANEELFKEFTIEEVFKTMFESHIRGISNTNGIAYFEKKKKELNY